MSVQSFPDMIFTPKKKPEWKLEGKLLCKQKTFIYGCFFNFIKGNTIARKFSLRSHFSGFMALQEFLRIWF